MSCGFDRAKLNAYVDESLAAGEVIAIEEHMRTCPACAAEAFSALQLKRATRAAAASLTLAPEFRMRPEFRRIIDKEIAANAHRGWMRPWAKGLSTAAVALLLITISVFLLMRHAAGKDDLAELLDLHVATLASSNPVDVVSTDRHTVKPWFQGKLPFTFNLPELQDSPYKLLGGKLAYFRNNPCAQLLFEDRQHKLSVFILQNASAGFPLGADSVSSDKGFSVETWSNAGLRFVLMSDASPGDVRALSELLRNANP